MSEHDPGEAAYDDISRLLAHARVTDPIPADVTARLDDQLADLVDSRETRSTTVPSTAARAAEVIPLRRRMLPRLLAAAAAVVIVGGAAYGVDQISRSGAGQSSNDSSADSAASASAGTAVPHAQEQQKVPGTAPDSAAGAATAPALTRTHFKAGVTALLADTNAADGRSARLGPSTMATPGSTRPAQPGEATPGGTPGETPGGTVCTPPAGVPLTAGQVTLPISLDGQPAVLVVQPVQNHRQVAEAYACATTSASSPSASSGAQPPPVPPLATATITR